MMQHLNLLPTSFLKRSLIRVRMKQWGTVLSLLWCGIVFLYLVNREEIQRELAEVEQLRLEVRPVRLQSAETVYANSETARLRKRQQLGIGLEHKNIPLQALGKVSQAASSQSGDLYVNSFSLNSRQTTSAQATRAASNSSEPEEPATEMSLLIDGIAVDDLTITSFVNDLTTTGMFVNVELISIQEQRIDDRQVRTFNIECKL
ncbi:MAG: hypothetical protein CMJ46_09815 [Planctomyces sp.]|nr:hypothetical protein [Planctomyces sp.]